MSKKEIPDNIKLTIWQSIRNSIVSWDSASISLLTTGSVLISSAYGIIIVNSNQLGPFLAAFLSLILFLASAGLSYIIRRFTNSIIIGVQSAKTLEDQLFGKEDNVLKFTSTLAKYRLHYFPYFQNKFYSVWGTGLVFFSAILTLWRILVWMKSF